MRWNFILPQIPALLGVYPDPLSEINSTVCEAFASQNEKKKKEETESCIFY